MKWLDVTEDDLDEALACVKYDHDPIAARSLIEYFHERFQEGSSYNQRILLEFVGHAFDKIVENNWTADQAFGLKLKRGHYRRKDTTERDATAVAYMVLLRRLGWTYLDAKNEAANLVFPDGKGEKAVEAAYAACKKEFKLIPDKTLISMLPEGTPLISRDMSGSKET